ncbi:hypothetical protein LCGC14_2586360 [marine sediment metagenome]|uniref:Uncharacterized protein n=1 Tax=marine sediment metagenome TaxID=412755 RepID=A0A0F9ACV4_9ZZZZ
MSQRTDLQIIVQALTAVQYEIQALSLAIKAPDTVYKEMHALQVDAKTLMQSAQADADVIATVELAEKRQFPPSYDD